MRGFQTLRTPVTTSIICIEIFNIAQVTGGHADQVGSQVRNYIKPVSVCRYLRMAVGFR